MPRLNPGRVSAVAIGAHAGWFRRVNGRWPMDFAELIRLDCPRLDQDRFAHAHLVAAAPLDEQLCNVLSELPYEVVMQPRAGNLRVMVARSNAAVVCRLTVLAPTAASAAELTPMIRISLFSFDCPGEGEAL